MEVIVVVKTYKLVSSMTRTFGSSVTGAAGRSNPCFLLEERDPCFQVGVRSGDKGFVVSVKGHSVGLYDILLLNDDATLLTDTARWDHCCRMSRKLSTW